MAIYDLLENRVMKVLCKYWVLLKLITIVLIIFSFVPFLLENCKKQKIEVLKKSINKIYTYQCYIFLMKNLYFNWFYLVLYGWLIYCDQSKVQKKLLQIIEIENIHVFSRLISEDKPLIIFCSHIGCFFVPLFFESFWNELKKDKILSIIAPIKNQGRKDCIKEIMDNHYFDNFEFIDIMESKSSALNVVKVLRSNGIVCTAIDTYYNHTNNWNINFLDNSYSLPVGIVKIGIRYKCNYVHLTTFFKKGKLKINVLDDGDCFKGNHKYFKEIENQFNSVVKNIESKIYENPAHWVLWKSYINQVIDKEKYFNTNIQAK